MADMEIDPEVLEGIEAENEDTGVVSYETEYMQGKKRYLKTFRKVTRDTSKKQKLDDQISPNCLVSQQNLPVDTLLLDGGEGLRHAMLLKQIEFYFSDANLVEDKHLRSLFNNPYEQAVEITTILSFNQIKRLIPDEVDCDERVNLIVNGIKPSRIVKVTKEGLKINRKKWYNHKTAIVEVSQRTLFINNVAADATSVDVVKQIKSLGFTLVLGRQLKDTLKQPSNGFKIVFDTQDAANRFLEQMKCIQVGSMALFEHSTYFTKPEWEQQKTQALKYKKLVGDIEGIDLNSTNSEHITKEGILNIKGLVAEISKYQLREAINFIQRITYLDYTPGEPEGKVRFKNKDTCNDFIKSLEVVKERQGIGYSASTEVYLLPICSKIGKTVDLKFSHLSEVEFEGYLTDIQNQKSLYCDYKSKGKVSNIPTFVKYIYRRPRKSLRLPAARP